MTSIDPRRTETARQNQQRSADVQRTSEVARQATDIQRQTGCTRTEALRAAEKLVPWS
jgi:hypothetical protein